MHNIRVQLFMHLYSSVIFIKFSLCRVLVHWSIFRYSKLSQYLVAKMLFDEVLIASGADYKTVSYRNVRQMFRFPES